MSRDEVFYHPYKAVCFVLIKTTNPKIRYPFKSILLFLKEDMETGLPTQHVWYYVALWIMHLRGRPVELGLFLSLMIASVCFSLWPSLSNLFFLKKNKKTNRGKGVASLPQLGWHIIGWWRASNYTVCDFTYLKGPLLHIYLHLVSVTVEVTKLTGKPQLLGTIYSQT